MREGLYAIVGGAGVGADAESYRIGDASPCAVIAPESEAEVCALMEYAHGARFPCIVAGGGTHLTALAPPAEAWWLLSTRRLNRVIDYSPQDLVLTVGAGITLQAVQELLREQNQYLPWNPALPTEATIGGIVASNRAGSWRYRYGTPRDRLLALRAVRPDGIAFKSGAKVVKSVAGYDLHRLLCGAWGALAVITEITLKVQPLPLQFDAVGWFTTWQELEPTLADLMRMPIQPDGISVLALRNPPLQGPSGLRTVSQAEWTGSDLYAPQVTNAYPIPFSLHKTRLSPCRVYGAVSTLETPSLTTPLPQLQPLTESQSPMPYVVLEFSGRPEGVAWQIQHLREQGYPAEPVSEAQLKQLRDWLAPRAHTMLVQLLMRPNEIAEAMARWTEIQGVSALAHAGNGVLYIACDETPLNDALIQRLRTPNIKYRVLSGATQLRQQTNHELPRPWLNTEEQTLMRALKHALDPKTLLPNLF
ncbi:MAG: hypothetical protein KatS3mg020_0215 [Fimbriimonadales bacterium]|nr:MAG: hypothetical protein KatS3mg020_0215 [Fimbriimonadales bacterium]